MEPGISVQRPGKFIFLSEKKHQTNWNSLKFEFQNGVATIFSGHFVFIFKHIIPTGKISLNPEK